MDIDSGQLTQVAPQPRFQSLNNTAPPAAALGESLVFQAASGGGTIWATGGSPETTVALSDAARAPLGFAILGSRLYFSANDAIHGRELWSTDGTPAGTRLEWDAYPGSPSGMGDPVGASVASPLVTAADRVWMGVNRPGGGDVFGLAPGDAGPRRETAYQQSGGLLTFGLVRTSEGGLHFREASANAFHPREVFRFDGSPQGATVLPGPLNSVSGSNGALPLALFRDGAVYPGDVFPAQGGQLAAGEPHFTRIRDGATSRLADINPDVVGGWTGPAFAWADGCVFGARESVPRIWYSSGPPDQPRPILEFSYPGVAMTLVAATPLRGGQLLFVQYPGAPLAELQNVLDMLYLEHPSAQPTLCARVPWADTAPAPGPFVQLDDRVVFRLTSGGSALWTSDATPQGTLRLAQLGGSASSASGPALCEGRAYVTTSVVAGCGDASIVETDGTEAGTSVSALFPAGCSGAVSSLTPMAHGLLFLRGLSEAYSYDVTSRELRRLDAGSLPFSTLGPLHPVGNEAFVRTSTGSGGAQRLWLSRATPSSIEHVTEKAPQSDDMAAIGNLLVYSRYEPSTGAELWVSDGTDVGTRLLRDIRPGDIGSWPAGLITAGGRVFFTADDGPHGRELWSTDGTPEGTRLEGDSVPGPMATGIPGGARLVSAGRRLYVGLLTPMAGEQLWALELPGFCNTDYDGNSTLDDVAALGAIIAGAENPPGLDPDFNRDGNADQDDLRDLLNAVSGAGCP